MKYPIVTILVTAGLVNAVSAQASQHQHHQHGHQHDHAAAHQHGAGQLNAALDGTLLEMAFTIPGLDIVGFEHPPRTNSQKQAIVDAHEQLSAPKLSVKLPERAECVATEAVIESDFDTQSHHQHESDQSPQHADFHAYYQFECGQPEALKKIELALFSHFPSLQQIELQAISDHGQTGAVLTREQPVFSF